MDAVTVSDFTKQNEKQDIKSITSRENNIDVPSIFLKGIDTYENPAWRDANSNISDYFNYGFNEETFKKYQETIQAKIPELSYAVEQNRLNLSHKDIFKYIFNYPADYGGLGEVLDEQKYENLKFFEFKPSKNKPIPNIEVRAGAICVPIERNENLNINYNPHLNTNISPLNYNYTQGQNPFFPINYYYRQDWTTLMKSNEKTDEEKEEKKEESKKKRKRSRSKERHRDKGKERERKSRSRDRDKSRDRRRKRSRSIKRRRSRDRSRDRRR